MLSGARSGQGQRFRLRSAPMISRSYMLWSLAITPDGSTLHAVNPAIGVTDPSRKRSAMYQWRGILAGRASPLHRRTRRGRGHRHGLAHVAHRVAAAAPVRHPAAFVGRPTSVCDRQHGRPAHGHRHAYRREPWRCLAPIVDGDPAHRQPLDAAHPPNVHPIRGPSTKVTGNGYGIPRRQALHRCSGGVVPEGRGRP